MLSARLTKVPWDSLGYSQIDNFVLTRLAPFTGVYGLSFRAGRGQRVDCLGPARPKTPFTHLHQWPVGGAGIAERRSLCAARSAGLQATAVLLQQNLNVNQDNSWPGAEYDEHMSQFIKLSTRTCGPYLAGMPELDAYPVTPDCPVVPVTPTIILWPESPAPFLDKDARLLAGLRTLALSMDTPVIAGTTSLDPHGARFDMYNSALFVGQEAQLWTVTTRSTWFRGVSTYPISAFSPSPRT